MANVLILEPSGVAACALQGILARGGHRSFAAANGEETWKALHELVLVDLLIMDLETKGGRGEDFIRRIRENCTLRELPVVVYSEVRDIGAVHRAVALGVQAYLTKPYNDDLVYREIAKAVGYPWRRVQFEDEKPFCAQLGYRPEELRKMRDELAGAVERLALRCPDWARTNDGMTAAAAVSELADAAEAAGVWAVANYARELLGRVNADDWEALAHAPEHLELVRRMTLWHLNPEHVPEGFLSDEERQAKEDAAQRVIWETAEVTAGHPVVPAAEVKRRLEELPSCPAIETAIAAFQMTANGMASSLGPVTSLVAKDPGLAFQVLAAANQLPRDGTTPVEDVRTAVNLLGEIRLNALAKQVPGIPMRHLRVPPADWTRFWTFQAGVARVARFICEGLELRELLPYARTAGLIHDVGKLLLFRLYPFALPAVVGYARAKSIGLAEAEQAYFGWTTRKMGEHFAEKSALPPVYCRVIRWADEPEQVPEDGDLVAVVALARALCQRHGVGDAFEPADPAPPPLDLLSAWGILKRRAFLNFDFVAFQAEAEAFCRGLTEELSGRDKWHSAMSESLPMD